MIDIKCASIEWINKVSSAKKADRILVQKLIRALILLEGLKESGLDFIFKGGTALMLLLESDKRLSIDIDIVIPGKSIEIDKALQVIAASKGFSRVEEVKRASQTGIKKLHFRFWFPNAIHDGNEDFVLLDILFEENLYQKLIPVPITSGFIGSTGEITQVLVPDFNNFMGDKLTAFAPNTTGIPYFKKGQPMGLEIIKQLYDLGNIFEYINDIGIVKRVFSDIVRVELGYRGKDESVNIVLQDIIENCLAITLRENMGSANFEILQQGLKQASGFIYSENYHVEKAITHAARIAYIAALIKNDSPFEKYTDQDMMEWKIEAPANTKLNKLKKTNSEAFYYWYRFHEVTRQG